MEGGEGVGKVSAAVAVEVEREMARGRAVVGEQGGKRARGAEAAEG